MAIKKFYIESNGAKIFGVGFRPSLVGLASEYNLDAAVRNLIKENKIEIIVSGSDEEVDSYYKEISNPENDMRIFPDDKKYVVTALQGYDGVKPDWHSYNEGLMIGQLGKAMPYLARELGKIETEFTRLDDKYGKLGSTASAIEKDLSNISSSLSQTATRIEQDLGKINTTLTDLKGDIKTMTSSVKVVSDFIATSLGKDQSDSKN